jgi:hypothetical protein
MANQPTPRDHTEDDHTVNEGQLGNPEPAKAHWPTLESDKRQDKMSNEKDASGTAKSTAPQQSREALRSKH